MEPILILLLHLLLLLPLLFLILILLLLLLLLLFILLHLLALLLSLHLLNLLPFPLALLPVLLLPPPPPDIVFPSILWPSCEWFPFVYSFYCAVFGHFIFVSKQTQSLGFNIIYYVPVFISLNSFVLILQILLASSVGSHIFLTIFLSIHRDFLYNTVLKEPCFTAVTTIALIADQYKKSFICIECFIPFGNSSSNFFFQEPVLLL